MAHLITTQSPADWQKLTYANNLAALSVIEWEALQPDEHLIWMTDTTATARCSVWRTSLPAQSDRQPAAIGHFEATSTEAGAALLQAAAQHLQNQGCPELIGPINANTWHKYRLVTQRGQRPPFFLEPEHPDYYVDAWAQAGFRPMADFHSASMPPQLATDPRLERVEARLHALGVRIRNIDTNNFTDDLRKFYSVARISFADNLLYTPISEGAFLALYEPIRPYIQPDFVWLAELDGACIGFCFCIPDLLQAQSGQPTDTLIVKSLATLPDRAYAGLGLWLTQIAHQAAGAADFTSVIHALMHPGSRIKHFGKGEMDTFRHYTLFHRPLSPT